MTVTLRRTALALFLASAALVPARAQVAPTQSADDTAYASERSVIESALGTVVQVLERAVLGEGSGPLGASLRGMASDLTSAARPFGSSPGRAVNSTDVTLSRAEVQRLAALLRSLDHQTARLVEEASPEDEQDLTDLQRTLSDALALVEAIERRMPEAQAAYETMPPVADRRSSWDTDNDEAPEWDDWNAGDETDDLGAAAPHGDGPQPITWTYDSETSATRTTTRTYGNRTSERSTRRSSLARAPFDTRDRWEHAYVGASQDRNPFREDALYRHAPAIRYNRVEGIVLGAALPKLDWYDTDRAALYGQVGYAFSLEDIRYTVGLEARPIQPSWRGRRAFDLKVGGAYQQNTVTNDLWKSSWFENSAAAFLFERDFFDYFEVEGWTVYSIARMGEFTQASVGYRDEIYRNLDATASFSIFDGDAFRANPQILPQGEDERLRSVVTTLEAGRIADWYDVPLGGILRAEAEFGQGLGGDTGFNRFVADARAYLPLAPGTGIALRMRGGYASDGAPIQKRFTLGGLGTTRGYPQNSASGTRALVANAEVTFDDVDLSFFDSIQFIGFADLGWTNDTGSNAFDLGEALPTAGIGLGLAERYVRLELAFPLRNAGFGTQPTLWFRLLPTF